MRTTIDMPDPLYRRAKAAAALRGSKLKTFIAEAVEARLRSEVRGGRRGKRLRFPLVRCGRPGSIRLKNRMIEGFLTDDGVGAVFGAGSRSARPQR